LLAFSITASVGLPLIFLFVALETAGVLPMSPGEIAVISGGIEAADHHLVLLWVIVVAACGAIVGDNIGYVIGRIGGRPLLEKGGPFAKQRRKALKIADPFFEKHGGKAVFYGRWLPVLRVFASWFAGGTKMKWRVFFVWNALGGITWALTMGLLGYFVGGTAKTLISDLGTFGMVAIVLAVIAFVVFRRWHNRRSEDRLTIQAETADGPAAVTGPAAAVRPMVVPAGQATMASPIIPPGQATMASPVVVPAGQATMASPIIPAGQATRIRPRPQPIDAPQPGAESRQT